MSAAERKRRFRERQRRGLVIVPVEVGVHALAEMLIEIGELRPQHAEDFAEITAATSRWVADEIDAHEERVPGDFRSRW